MRVRSATIALAAVTCGLAASAAVAAPNQRAHVPATTGGSRLVHAASDRGGGWGESSTTGKTDAASKSGATVHTAHTSAGTILVNAKGDTLYLFTADGKSTDRCVKVAGCAKAWPPLTVTGKPTAGTGIKASLLGTIAITGGRHQVTYDGHPLYTFAEDSSPASTGYFGATSFGGTWYGVSAAGSAVR